MREDGKRLLNLMFREGETICISPNKYGYHSVNLEDAFKDRVILTSANPDFGSKEYSTDDMQLVALNPIYGHRQDANCIGKYRNFLIEIDVETIEKQMQYIKFFKIPYSAMIFSGSKSVHTLISLEEDIKEEKQYRKIAEWIFNIITLADRNCKNPSRGIRIPGAIRDGKEQKLLEFIGTVKNDDLFDWLKQYIQYMPKERQRMESKEDASFESLSKWAQEAMVSGIDRAKGRNSQWFALSVEFALNGFSEDKAIEYMGNIFTPESDFTEREWLSSIKSGYKYAYFNKKST